MDIRFEKITTPKTICFEARDLITNRRVGAVVLCNNVSFNRFRHLCNGNKLLEVRCVATNLECRRRGIASALLNKVIEEYKDYNLFLLCSPSHECDEKYKNISNLKKFYRKFGFISTGELLPTMIRKCI
jgi:ribosomal protein S18 acetylase RimI-like enzyme